MIKNPKRYRAVCKFLWKQIDDASGRISLPHRDLLRRHISELGAIALRSSLVHSSRVVALAALRVPRCRDASRSSCGGFNTPSFQWKGIEEAISRELCREAGEPEGLTPASRQAYEALSEGDAEFLHRHEIKLRLLWERVRHSDAEWVARDAAVRAIATFDPSRNHLGATDPDRAKWYWIRTKVTFDLRNLVLDASISVVRKAFREFQQTYGHAPNLRQLSRFGKITPREVIRVWADVAEDLNLPWQQDPILESIPRPIENSIHSDSLEDSHAEVHTILAQLPPDDACLLVMRHIAERSDIEILNFLQRVRRMLSLGTAVASVQSSLDKFCLSQETQLQIPWNDRLLTIKSPGQLRVRIHRAGETFRRRFRAKHRTGSPQDDEIGSTRSSDQPK